MTIPARTIEPPKEMRLRPSATPSAPDTDPAPGGPRSGDPQGARAAAGEPAPAAPDGGDEAARLAAVRRYHILDTPPDGAFDRVCALAARFFDVPVATVSIVDEDRIWFKATQGLDAVQIPREPGLCASAILQDEPYVISDGLDDPRALGHSLVQAGVVRFYAAAPLITADGHRLGTINVIDTRPRDTTDEERQTLRDLAAVVVDELELRLAALREVRRERESRELALAQKQDAERLARTLQRSLSPPTLPDIEGLEVAVLYQPWSEDQVGGDFYDLFPLAAGRWGLFLGDVCGKGPEAASLTSLARYTLRTAAMLNEGPRAILRDLNTALRMETVGEMPTCTAVYGEISIRDREIAALLAVAGHPAPLIRRADGTVEQSGVRGTMLGAFDDVEFGMRRVALEAGDALVIYSDGLLDTHLDGAPLDEERLAALLAGAPGMSAGELIDHIRGLLGRLQRPRRDDVAVLALSRPRAA